MSDEPSFPEDVPVGAKAEEAKEDTAKQGAGQKRKRQLMGAGVAAGIGSAAIVAALLYAGRNRRGDRNENS